MRLGQLICSIYTQIQTHAGCWTRVMRGRTCTEVDLSLNGLGVHPSAGRTVLAAS